MNNNIVVKPSGVSWNELKEQAEVLLKTGFLPQSLRTPEQVIAVVLTGKEIGVPMMEAIRGINIIQGKPSVSPQLMLALANRTGQLEDIKIETSHEGALVEITRKGRAPHTERFGPQEATALGLFGKDNYKKQPATMFKWRALAAALRVTFPDAISGLYTPEEMGADVTVTDEGDMQVSQDSREAKEVPGIQVKAHENGLSAPNKPIVSANDASNAYTPDGLGDIAETHPASIEDMPFAAQEDYTPQSQATKAQEISKEAKEAMLKPINTDQRRYFWARAKELGFTSDSKEIREVIKHVRKDQSTKGMTLGEMNEILELCHTLKMDAKDAS